MSKHHETTFECPECKTANEITVWDSLNADLDPAAKDRLLAGGFFSEECTNCKAVTTVKYPMLYHDMTKKVLIQLVFSKEEAEEFKRSIAEASDSSSGLPGIFGENYLYRTVLNQNDLMEKVHLIDNDLDDRVVEVMKYMIEETAQKENPEINIVNMLFVPESPYTFLIFTEERGTLSFTFSMDMYNSVMESYHEILIERSKDCWQIDRNWVIGNFSL